MNAVNLKGDDSQDILFSFETKACINKEQQQVKKERKKEVGRMATKRMHVKKILRSDAGKY